MILARGGTIGVRVLDQFASVAARQPGLSYPEIREVREPVRAVCAVEPRALATHDLGRHRAERYGFSGYDALMAAAARWAGGRTPYSEDRHDGQTLDRRRVVRNLWPARPPPGRRGPVNPK